MHASNSAIIFVLLLSYVPTLSAQETHDCKSRNLIVDVRDRQGKFVPALDPTSFEVRLGGKVVKVQSATIATARPRVVVVLDNSGSMSQSNHNFDASRFAAGHLIETQFTTIDAALVIFSDRLIDQVAFGRPSQELFQKVAHLKDGERRTALYDSLLYAASLFRTPRDGDVIYLISDGGDNKSKATRKDVEKVLIAKGIRLFWFVLNGPSSSKTPEEELGAQEVQNLVRFTGGRSVQASSLASKSKLALFDTAVEPLYEEMKTYYVLQMAPAPETLDRDQPVDLHILDTDGKQQKNVDYAVSKRWPRCERGPEP